MIVESNDDDVLVRIIIGYEGWLKLHNKPHADFLHIRF